MCCSLRLVKDGDAVAQLACEATLERILKRSRACVEYMQSDAFASGLLLNKLKAKIASALSGGSAEDEEEAEDIDDIDDDEEEDLEEEEGEEEEDLDEEEEEEEIAASKSKRSRR